MCAKIFVRLYELELLQITDFATNPNVAVAMFIAGKLKTGEFLKRIGKKGVYPLLDHICRKHNDKDRERFSVMINNRWSFGEMRRARPDLEHEHARVFDNSYVVQWWDLPSKTILAHIHKDGFQFIHPDGEQLQQRSKASAQQ